MPMPPSPLDPLERNRILRHAGSADARVVLEVLERVDSTQNWLAGRSFLPHGEYRVCVAETQTAGRGRRNRVWVSDAGEGLWMSMAGIVRCPPESKGTLAIVAAVIVARQLNRLGMQESIGLKWPNDLYLNGRKLGGVLVEVVDGEDGLHAIIGIGINVHSAPRAEPPSIALGEFLPSPDRCRLAGLTLEALVWGLQEFEKSGFGPFKCYYRQFDCLMGRPIKVFPLQGPAWDGTAMGLADDGTLRVRSARGIEAFYAGEVTIRL